jgi:protein-S-isoprenylcysteine O-methyltransferase Ste14
MSSAFNHPVFDEPDAVDANVKPKRFKFAPTFLLDFGFSAAMLIGLTPTWRQVILFHPWAGVASVPMLLVIFAVYASKTQTIRHLDGKGGDARTYVKSGALVTTGPYGWSRHPTYALAMGQFLLWALLGLYLQTFAPWSPLLLAAVVGVPLGFFLVNDRVVMPTEEAMLRKLHPDAFDAYAARVNRWVGRRGA